MPQKGSTGKTAAALVIGGILGAGIALLFAPHSGRRTRRQIEHIGNKALHKAEEAKEELRHSLGNLVDDVSEKIDSEIDRGWEWTEERMAELRRAFEAGKDHIRSEIDKLRGA
ncbi:MAG: YtxH domain-containing protein [Acidobacteria bacterium]|nr:YtxH domain-containing protein [Acidobacteriota bacterium]